MATIQCETCQYIFRQVELPFSKEIQIHLEHDHHGQSFNVEVLT